MDKYEQGVTMKEKVTLNEHLRSLNQNSRASENEISRLRKTVAKKFVACGYEVASTNTSLINEYIRMIFETQNYRCTFWLRVGKEQLNGVWNRPWRGYIGWKATNVFYEVDHVNPVNNGGVDKLTNYQFLSANANQFTKCSLTCEDLLRRVDLSDRLKRRITTVLKRRKRLFKSEEWKLFMQKMEESKYTTPPEEKKQ